MKPLKLFLLLLLLFIVTIIEFTCIYYSYKEPGKYLVSKIAFAVQRDVSFIAISILTLLSFTSFFTFNKIVKGSKVLSFLSFYLIPLSLILIYCIAVIIDGFNIKGLLLDAAMIAIPFLFNLTLVYLFYIRTSQKEPNT